MKALKLSAIPICLVLFSLSAYSQITVPASEIFFDKLRLNKIVEGTDDLMYSDIVGNPYLFKDFCPGVVVFKTGETFDIDLRYDIYADVVHMRYKDNIWGLAHPEKLSMIIIDTVKLIYDEMTSLDKNRPTGKGSYFIVMSDGRCRLLARKNMRIQDAELPKLYTDAKPAKFINQNDDYYLKLENQNAVLIKNRKDVLSVLSDQAEAINKYISQNGFSAKREDDLSAIVNYYNGL